MSRAYSEPIRMFVIVFFPFSFTKMEPFHSLSFGTYPGVTAGEIQELTASGPEVIECDYLLPERFSFNPWSFHFLKTSEGNELGLRHTVFTPGEEVDVVLYKHQQPLVTSEERTTTLSLQRDKGLSSLRPPQRYHKMISEACSFTLSVAVRHVLMMTGPRVWSTLKTTDDGTFGKCRNPEEKNETFFDREIG